MAAIDLRQTRRDAVADEIERVAIDLFAARGLDVTVDEIAEAAGISARTFFRYFPTKGDVVRAHRRRLVARLVRALAARPADEGPVRAMREAQLATARMRPEDRARVALVGTVLAEGRSNGAYAAAHDPEQIEALVVLVAERFGVSAATDPRPGIVVAVIMAAADVVFGRWVERGGRGDLEAAMAEAFGMLDAGLAGLDVAAHRSKRKAR